MIVAYIRVSTIEQNEQRQLENLKKYDIEKYYIEKVSAKDLNRPELESMLNFVRDGDVVVINDFSRLARSTMDLLTLVEYFTVKNITLISDKEKIDTSSASGKLLLTMIAAINEFERENMLERQREGIAIAKLAGKYKGRKKIDIPDGWDEIYNQWKTREITATKAMQILGLKRNTFYKLLKEYENTN